LKPLRRASPFLSSGRSRKIQDTNKLAIQKERVVQLLARLVMDERNAKAERAAIAQAYPASDDGFTLLEELELLTTRIQGYASQLEYADKVEKHEQAIADLQQCRLFDVPLIAQFYRDACSQYPQTYAYIGLLDYLRLLVLEYLSMQPIMQPVSA
jgi:hypothetical protein